MLYKLTEWEDNGYHDSYFNESWWNTETGAVEFHEVGATAYAGPHVSKVTPINDPVELERAIAWLAEHIFTVIRAAEHKDMLTPEPANCVFGREFRLLRNARNGDRKLEAGTVGEVVKHQAFGKFYAKGYNRPDRSNTRVQLRLLDGSMVWVSLSALRQHREPMSDELLRERARELARHCGFSVASGWKFAWDTRNWALEFLMRQPAATGVAA